MGSSDSWDAYYKNNKNDKPLIPESFIARCFLSQRPIPMLDNYNFTDKTILDVGCGEGRHINFFETLGFNATGVEISDNKVIDLRKKFPQSTFFMGTSSSLSCKNEFFDYLVAVNSIYYLNSNDTLENNILSCAIKIKIGGVFIASFIGTKHFIVNDDDKNSDASIKYTHHQCDKDISIEVIKTKAHLQNMLESTNLLKVNMIGEIQDELLGKNRHLYYVVAYRTPITINGKKLVEK
jgi:SAM-dependent methyltransferase